MIPPIEVEGLAELDRAFGQVDTMLRRELRTGVRTAAEPVLAIAHEFAISSISGMSRQRTVDWSQFRVGSTANMVYVAPKERGRRGHRGPAGKRPNLARLLLESMEKSVERARPRITKGVERAVEAAITEVGLG